MRPSKYATPGLQYIIVQPPTSGLKSVALNQDVTVAQLDEAIIGNISQ